MLRRNLIANYLGNGWVALMSFAFVPLYIKVLGIETYGLIGFFISFQAVLLLLDLGLGAAVNRELARMSVDDTQTDDMGHLLRTLESAYWLIALLIALIVLALAPFLADHWLKSKSMPRSQVTAGLTMLGLVFAANWPFALYSGVLLGLQKQVSYNVLRVCIATARSGGAVLVLLFLSPTFDAYLNWQLLCALSGSVLAAAVAWHALPRRRVKARFQFGQLRRIWKFAAGLSGIGLTVVVLTQADKIVLSRMLSLENFGYYTLAWAVAGGLATLVSPIFTAFYPRLVQAASRGNEAEVAHAYHQGSRLMALVLLPAGVLLALFSHEVLFLWTRNAVVADRTHLVLSMVVVGTVLNGMMNVPYAMQLAYGWTRLALFANLTSITLIVPFVIVMARYFGAVGAASAWALLNLGYVLVSQQVMHRRLLRNDLREWYVGSLLKPLSVTLLFLLSARGVAELEGVSSEVAMLIGGCAFVASVIWIYRSNKGVIRPRVAEVG